jgi:hypothetical protein
MAGRAYQNPILDVRPLIKRAERDDPANPLLMKVDRWQEDNFKGDVIRILIKHVFNKILTYLDRRLRL